MRRRTCAQASVAGILSQIGDTGGAYFTGTIAIHSFNSLVFRNKVPGWLCLAATVFGWLVAILLGEFLVAMREKMTLTGGMCFSCHANLDSSLAFRPCLWHQRALLRNLD